MSYSCHVVLRYIVVHHPPSEPSIWTTHTKIDAKKYNAADFTLSMWSKVQNLQNLLQTWISQGPHVPCFSGIYKVQKIALKKWHFRAQRKTHFSIFFQNFSIFGICFFKKFTRHTLQVSAGSPLSGRTTSRPKLSPVIRPVVFLSPKNVFTKWYWYHVTSWRFARFRSQTCEPSSLYVAVDVEGIISIVQLLLFHLCSPFPRGVIIWVVNLWSYPSTCLPNSPSKGFHHQPHHPPTKPSISVNQTTKIWHFFEFFAVLACLEDIKRIANLKIIIRWCKRKTLEAETYHLKFNVTLFGSCMFFFSPRYASH